MKWTVLILGLGLFTSSGPPATCQRGAATQDTARAKPATAERDSTRSKPKIARPAPAGEPHLERRKPPGRKPASDVR